MIKKLLITFLMIIKIIPITNFYYTTRFQLLSKRTLPDTIGNFMNLNEVLNNQNKSLNTNLKIRTYKNKSISFKYNTISCLDNYKYEHKYLFINKENYYATYNFNLNELNEKENNNFKYLFKINVIPLETNKNNNNKTLLDVCIKYKLSYLSYIPNINDVIYHFMNMCVNKEPKPLNCLLRNYFD